MSKYIVEELMFGNWFHVGEFDTTAIIAQAIKYSPAKLRNAIKEMKIGWNRLPNTNIRIGIK